MSISLSIRPCNLFQLRITSILDTHLYSIRVHLWLLISIIDILLAI